MATVGETHRLAGVDVARAVALLGIMSVHIFPPLTASGDVHPAFRLDSGRTPALFPVLAGVGLVLGHKVSGSPHARTLVVSAAGVWARALVLIVIGLLLGRVDSPPLVILVDFGLMFVVGSFFLGAGVRVLAMACAFCVLVVPQVSYLVRTGPAGVAGSPQIPGPLGLGQPFPDHALASNYPVLPWMGYFFAGMALARVGLTRQAMARRMLVGGAVVAVVAKLASVMLLAMAGGADALRGHTTGLHPVTFDLGTQLAVGLSGTTPTTDPRWLLVSAPHSATTFDLLHTGGAAVAILGLCLLVTPRLSEATRRPLVAVGSMTLTLYSAHVLALWREGPLVFGPPWQLYLVQVAVAVVVATLWRSLVGRGPLEWVAARVERVARRTAARLLDRRRAVPLPADA